MKSTRTDKQIQQVAEYKITENTKIQKSLSFLYTNNEISERECKQAIFYKITSKNEIKYLEINLTKDAKELYAENYKILIRKLKIIQKMESYYCQS